MQLSPSVMDGRELQEVTTYEYEDGLLVRAVTVRDSEWTEVDRAEMLALAAYRATLCPCGCGFLRADTMANEKLGPTPSFTASYSACRASLAQRETAAAVDDPNKPPPVSAGARVWTVRMHEPRK